MNKGEQVNPSLLEKPTMTFSDQSYNLLVNLDMKHCQLPPDELSKMETMLSPLGDMVRNFPVSKLHVLISYRHRTSDYVVRTSLILPGETLVSSEHHALAHTAFEHCINNLVREVRRYKDQLGAVPEQAKQREGTHHELVPTIAPNAEAIEAAVQSGDYAAFRTATSGYEGPVTALVGRWVERYPEVAARLGRDLRISDLVEDVFLIAFEEYEYRPKEIRFGEWLGRHIDTAVKAMAHHSEEELENINMVRAARLAETGREIF
jgi:ribosome-associated translation inhibitor RaiA